MSQSCSEDADRSINAKSSVIRKNIFGLMVPFCVDGHRYVTVYAETNHVGGSDLEIWAKTVKTVSLVKLCFFR